MTERSLLNFRVATVALSAACAMLATQALAQGVPPPQGAPAANPICQRLEAQLAAVDRGGTDPSRAEQIRRYEEAAARQSAELDRVTSQAKRMGCDSSGFFSLFSNQSAQCGPVNNQIQQMRGNLDQITTSLERLRGSGGSGSFERDQQRRSVIAALGQNNCGPQYANRGNQGGGGGFFETLFGGNNNNNNTGQPNPDFGAPASTYKTVCVRTCDGFYFPVSYATTPARFGDDEATCKNLCPAAEATLFTFRNNEDMTRAVSDQRPAVFVAAERVQVSSGVQSVLRLQGPGPDLGRSGEGRGRSRRRRTGRHHRHRRARKADVAAARRAGPADPPAGAVEGRRGTGHDRRAGGGPARRRSPDPHGRPDLHSGEVGQR